MNDIVIKRNWRTRFWDWACPEPWIEEERAALIEIARRIKMKNDLQEARIKNLIARANVDTKSYNEWKQWKLTEIIQLSLQPSGV